MPNMGLVNVCDFGAVGDFVHDDTAAIQAAIATAEAGDGTLFFPSPSVAFKVTSELVLNWPGCRIEGNSSNRQSSTIKAAAPMRSIFALRSSYGSPMPEDQALNRAYIEHISIDANFQADHCIISLGAEMSTFNDVRVLNALHAGIYIAIQQNPLGIGTITATCPGGSPTGVTISQVNPNYLNLPGSTNTGTVRLRCKTSGALGAATYEVSYDGGTTYQGAPQKVFSSCNMPITSNGYVVGITGLTIGFPAGAYAAGDFWDIPYTYTLGDYGIGPGIGTAQGAITYDEITYGQCGSVYISPSKAGSYGGFNTTTLTGTITQTSGSQIFEGVGGTNWMSCVGASCSRVMVCPDGDANVVYLGYVLSDTEIAVDPTSLPLANASGIQYAICAYGGYYEDFDGTPRHNGGQCGNCSNAMMFGPGGGGPIVRDFVASSAAGVGMSFMSGQTECQNCFWASTTAQAVWFSQNSAGFMRNPSQAALFFGSPTGGWMVDNNGQIAPLARGGASSLVQLYNAQLAPSGTLNVTGAGFTFSRPARFWGDTGGPSYVRFQSSSNVTLTGTPVISAGQLGQLLLLHNTFIQVGIVTIPDDALTGSGVISKSGTGIVMPPQSTALLLCVDSGKWLQVA